MRIRLRRELLAAGFAADEVQQQLRSGDLVRLRRGAYTEDRVPDEPERRHPLLVRAALAQVAPDAVVSHVSAAVLHGIAAWGTDLSRVHVTRSRRSGARRGPGVHVHAAPLEPDEVVAIDGMAVTSAARTLVDLARALPFEQAVCLLDDALHRGRTTRAAVEAALVRASRRPGCPAARRAAAFADGRSESVGESRSRVAVRRAGLPVPVLQWNVHSGAGTWLGRVDFGWPELGAVGEFDGRAKYGRLLRPGQDPGEVVFAEKVREDAIRAEGLAVVRWTWAELHPFDEVARRLRRAFR